MVPIGGLSEYAKSGLPTAVKGIEDKKFHLPAFQREESLR